MTPLVTLGPATVLPAFPASNDAAASGFGALLAAAAPALAVAGGMIPAVMAGSPGAALSAGGDGAPAASLATAGRITIPGLLVAMPVAEAVQVDVAAGDDTDAPAVPAAALSPVVALTMQVTAPGAGLQSATPVGDRPADMVDSVDDAQARSDTRVLEAGLPVVAGQPTMLMAPPPLPPPAPVVHDLPRSVPRSVEPVVVAASRPEEAPPPVVAAPVDQPGAAVLGSGKAAAAHRKPAAVRVSAATPAVAEPPKPFGASLRIAATSARSALPPREPARHEDRPAPRSLPPVSRLSTSLSPAQEGAPPTKVGVAPSPTLARPSDLAQLPLSARLSSFVEAALPSLSGVPAMPVAASPGHSRSSELAPPLPTAPWTSSAEAAVPYGPTPPALAVSTSPVRLPLPIPAVADAISVTTGQTAVPAAADAATATANATTPVRRGGTRVLPPLARFERDDAGASLPGVPVVAAPRAAAQVTALPTDITAAAPAANLPAAPFEIALSSSRLGNVHIGVDGAADDLRVSIGVAPAAAAIIAADAPRLIADLAASGIRLQALDLSGAGVSGQSDQPQGFAGSGTGQPPPHHAPNAPAYPLPASQPFAAPPAPRAEPAHPRASDRYA